MIPNCSKNECNLYENYEVCYIQFLNVHNNLFLVYIIHKCDRFNLYLAIKN